MMVSELIRLCRWKGTACLQRTLQPWHRVRRRSRWKRYALDRPGGHAHTAAATPPLTPACEGWTSGIEHLHATAEKALRHQVEIYGQDCNLGPTPNWQADPWLCSKQSHTQETLPPLDIKRIWKLSCMHYLIDLAAAFHVTGNQAYAQQGVADINHWLDANPVGTGCNWISPTEVGLRLCSWAFFLAIAHPHIASLENQMRERILNGVWEHCRFIMLNLEDDGLRTNHYVANLASLVVATSVVPELDQRGLHAWACARLEHAMVDQTGPCGGHFEHSTHYHRLVHELFLSAWVFASRLRSTSFSSCYTQRLTRMGDVLKNTATRSGFLPQVGDNDSEMVFWRGSAGQDILSRNIARYLDATESLIQDQSRPYIDSLLLLSGWTHTHNDTIQRPIAERKWRTYPGIGCFCCTSGPFDLLAVAAPFGSKGVGAHDHAHCGELLVSCEGREFICDAGTGWYTGDIETRNTFRSIHAHSVVNVGEEQATWKSGVEGAFHLRHPWRASGTVLNDGTLALNCRYRNNMITRKVHAGTTLKIDDTVKDKARNGFVQWVLHPDVLIQALDGKRLLLTRGDTQLLSSSSGADWQMVTIPYSEHFGHVGQSRAIRQPLVHGHAKTTFEIYHER
jgi:hypothetical protein